MAVIEITELTKRFGDVAVVDHLSFKVDAGTVVGFLGPNGAGKTTTLRMLLGLVEPNAGRATICGHPYREIPDALHVVGAVLEASSAHEGRTARNHLRIQAMAGDVDQGRIDEVLELVGLASAADRRTGEYSLGMRQRLGLATAMLCDPEVLILDEPTNGLDPEGVRWLRELLRSLAAKGRTVLVSSHILAEVAPTVDSVVILDHGRLVIHATLDELTAGAERVIRIRTPRPEDLQSALTPHGARTQLVAVDRLEVTGATAEQIGTLAAERGIPIFETTTEGGGLEDVFFKLTGQSANQEGSQ